MPSARNMDSMGLGNREKSGNSTLAPPGLGKVGDFPKSCVNQKT